MPSWQSRRGSHVQLALLYDTRRTKVKVLTTNVRHNAEFRGFRIDKDREAEVAAVSTRARARRDSNGSDSLVGVPCPQLERFPDVLRAFDHKQYWSKKELIARVDQTDVRCPPHAPHSAAA